MTLPLIDELRRNFPRAFIAVATQLQTAPIFERCSSVDVVLPVRSQTPELPRGTWNIRDAIAFYRSAIRPARFDMAINPRWDVDLYLATMLCNLTFAPVTVGYEDGTTLRKAKENRGFERGYNVLLPRGALQHEVLRNLDVLRALGLRPRDLTPTITLTDQQETGAVRWLDSTPKIFILVVGLPAAAAIRRWGAKHYIDLIVDLLKTHPLLPVLIADNSTIETAEAVRRAVPATRIASGLSLTEVMGVIAKCDLYVGSDSGLAHVSAALSKETIVISPHPIGGDPEHHNSPDRFRPYAPNAVVIRPTGREGCTVCCTALEPHCILDIAPSEVAAMVRRRIDARRNRGALS